MKGKTAKTHKQSAKTRSGKVKFDESWNEITNQHCSPTRKSPTLLTSTNNHDNDAPVWHI